MGLVVMLGIGVAIVLFVSKVDGKYKEAEEKKKEETGANNGRFMEENNIPENASLLYCTNIIVQEVPIENKVDVFVWKENNILIFCGKGVRKMEISIENVKYYTRTGDYRVDAVTEGGGVSLGKAIIGGLIGVIIGWIVGSMMDTYSDVSNFRIFTHSSVFSIVLTIIGLLVGLLLGGKRKVTTTNKEIDNRSTYFNYTENNQNKRMIFDSKAYDTLLKLIPEKEISHIENNKIIEFDNSQNDNVYKDIEKLSELKEKGILTEEEFNQKKQLLLKKIQ